MLNYNEILATQDMIEKRHLDIRTITMGISLLDCCDVDLSVCCAKIYKKITVNKKTGAITFSKGKYAKKTYSIKLKITAKGNSEYKSKVITKTVKVKVK